MINNNLKSAVDQVDERFWDAMRGPKKPTTSMKVVVDNYINSLKKTGSIFDYEAAKQWFGQNFPDAEPCEYDRFTFRVAERLGV